MAWLIQLVDDVAVHKFELSRGELRLGRHPECDVLIDDTAVSGQHARLTAKRNPDFPDFREYYLEDLGSTNGTFVNDQRVLKRLRLHHNDKVRLAWNEFKFVDDDEQDLEKTRHMVSG
ncbi:FHA domain-containing protein [Marinimicrobium sp. C2-29]|uniref:FHA domain-containing protein n=1 Tax=Marinimicrobium sp. C2-29 TaxID=3139825 RepID=UPI003139653A